MYYKIVKASTKNEVPYGDEGEISVSGPTVMIGYLKSGWLRSVSCSFMKTVSSGFIPGILGSWTKKDSSISSSGWKSG